MLSKFLLLFANTDYRKMYNKEKKAFYKKAMPIIATLLLILAVIMEILYRALDFGKISNVTSGINWGAFSIFIILSFIIRKKHMVWSSWLVCPLLTLLAYYYFAFVDY